MQETLLALRAFNPASLSWPVVSTSETIDVLRFVLGDSLTEAPRRRGQAEAVRLHDLAWCFVASQNFKPVAVRTYKTLQKKIEAGAVYFTPNGFFSRRRKAGDALRWLNALYVDIDDPALCSLDVFERCREAGLPRPTLITKTPHGLHVYWKIQRVRATKKALSLYSALLHFLAAAIGADLAAATPERFLRIPRSILYFSKSVYELQDFRAWRELNCLDEQPAERERGGGVVTRGVLKHPAIRVLLRGVEEGKRNNTALTLALAFRAEGYSEEQTLRELLEWNQRNDPPLGEKCVQRAVRGAYSGRYQGPSARWIAYLSNTSFRHRIIKQSPKAARPRKRSTLTKAKAKLYLAVRAARNGLRVCNVTRLAESLGVSERTFWRAINALKDRFITVRTVRNGRHGVLTVFQFLTLPKPYNMLEAGWAGGGHPGLVEADTPAGGMLFDSS